MKTGTSLSLPLPSPFPFPLPLSLPFPLIPSILGVKIFLADLCKVEDFHEQLQVMESFQSPSSPSTHLTCPHHTPPSSPSHSSFTPSHPSFISITPLLHPHHIPFSSTSHPSLIPSHSSPSYSSPSTPLPHPPVGGIHSSVSQRHPH